MIAGLALLLIVIALGQWIARCPVCGFYRDPEQPGCNCPDSR